MDEQCVVHPDIVPGRRSASIPAAQDVAEFEGANIRSKRDRKPVARGSVAHWLLFCAEATGAY